MSVDQSVVAAARPSKEEFSEAPLRRKSPWKKLWQDGFARTAFIVLCLFYLGAIFADPLTPYSMYYNDADLANAPPTSVYFQTENGTWTWPYVFRLTRS